MLTMPLVGGADLNGAASGDPTDLRFDRPYRESPTGLLMDTIAYSTSFLQVLRAHAEYIPNKGV
eukprot:1147372-Pleurochrysis_carterae.AAC.1